MPRITAAQQMAIDQQAAYYDSPDCPCAGLHAHRIYDAREWSGDIPAGHMAVDFTYRYEDGAMGLETTIFAPDGSVTDSQDFG